MEEYLKTIAIIGIIVGAIWGAITNIKEVKEKYKNKNND